MAKLTKLASSSDLRAVGAVIVPYDPNLVRLRENLAAIAPQVSRLLVIDNGSVTAAAIADLISFYPNAEFLENEENEGVSGALGRGFEWAKDHGIEWLLTLDQDSVSSSGMVDDLFALIADNVAMVTPFIVDRNKMSVSEFEKLAPRLPDSEEFHQAARKGAITSGALTNVSAVASVGGFDHRLFIDYVDYDLNARLLLSGFSILRANHTYLLHEVGYAQPTWLIIPRKSISGKWHLERFYSFGHSPQRCYYKARNRVIYSRRYGRSLRFGNEGIVQIPQQMFLTFVFEDQKLAKLAAFFRGIVAGITAPVQPWRAGAS